MKGFLRLAAVCFASLLLAVSCKDDDGNNELKNAFIYDGFTYSLSWGGYEDAVMPEQVGGGYALAICGQSIGQGGSIEDSRYYMFMEIPIGYINRTIDLSKHATPDDWAWNLTLKVADRYYFANEDSEDNDIVSGKLRVEKAPMLYDFTVSFDFNLSNGSNVRGNYTGRFIDMIDQEIDTGIRE